MGQGSSILDSPFLLNNAPRNSLNQNLNPLRFHSVHGEHIQLLNDAATARRIESFCRGICFSDRPVKISEKVTIRLAEASTSWSGVLRIGMTSTDPIALQGALPKYACPDLTNKPGYWAKAIHERHSEQGTIISYYVTVAGDLHYSVNGEDKGILLSGIDTRHSLWALIDIYGNSVGVDFVESRLRASSNNPPLPQTPRQPRPVSVISPIMAHPSNCVPRSGSDPQIDRILLPGINQLTLSPPSTSQVQSGQTPKLQPVPFHRTRGRHVRLSADNCLAWRSEGEFCQGYVFTARPIKTGEKLIVMTVLVPDGFPPGPSIACGRLLCMDSHCPLCSGSQQR
ncbi:protein neuralized-like isoform X2 [Artemia franciscana]|uniref:protein neuralized-like isoform X2 n=1 Tax=Artemia franciscana TaxID=6661 RepID=UPI0032DBCDE2